MIIVATWKAKFNAMVRFLIIVTIFIVISAYFKTKLDYSFILIMNGVFLIMNIMPVEYSLLYGGNKYFLLEDDIKLVELSSFKELSEEEIIQNLKVAYNYKILISTTILNILMLIVSSFL